jgi:Fe-S cluster biogenesis protein NfuA
LDVIRPSLQADGGDVQFVKWEETTGTVLVQLTGHCAHCPMAGLTLKNGIEAEIMKQVPEVKEVAAI